MNITIRLALPDERDTLIALMRSASLANERDRADLLAHPEVIDVPAEQIASGQVSVAIREGIILGFAVLLPHADSILELDGLFVDPAYWKQGIGRRLVEHCVGVAHREGITALHVIGNLEAQRFYQACGFQTLGPHATRFGPALSMCMLLKQKAKP